MDRALALHNIQFYIDSAKSWLGNDPNLCAEANMVRVKRAEVYVRIAELYHNISLSLQEAPSITGVAIQKDDKVYSLPKPLRHHHLFWQFGEEIGVGGIQGFITNEGKFLTREEAKIFAGGIGNHPTQLFSEDLW